MKSFKSTNPHGIQWLLVILLVGGSATFAFAQDATNKRGFQPGGSYAMGDLETINTTNGNLMLHFPLASLPVGRGGLSASINLIYNSKLYDSETQYFADYNHGCHGGSESSPCHWDIYQKQILKMSEDGGWRYGLNYSLKLMDRRDEFVNMPSEIYPQCWDPNWNGGLTPGYYKMRYRYKLILTFPDGSTHEMRPNGWSDGVGGDDPLGDYFDIRPDGYWDTCSSTQWYTGTITYYSVDGSFLRLDIQHRSVSEQTQDWTQNPWTLYLPNGSHVTGGGNPPQRIYDRNSNYVEIDNVGNYNNTGYGATQIVDQLGRSITWTTDGTDDLIVSQGVGDTLTWKVSHKTIRIQKSYWACAESLGCPGQVQQQDVFGQPVWVVDKITLPTQAGSLHHTIGYNAPDYQYPDAYVDSTGWGEVSRVTLPSGAYADYTFAQDGTQQPGSGYTPDVLRNAVTSKAVTYARVYDGSSSNVTDTWTYEIDRGGSSITGPDGGTTTQSFIDTQGAYWNSGQVYKTVHPDGSKTETFWAWNELGSGHSNAYPKTEFTSIKNASGSYAKTAIRDYSYDKNGNVTRVAEYDWAPYGDVSRDSQGWPTGAIPGAPVKITVNTYSAATPDAGSSPGSNTYVYWSSGSPNLRNAITSTEVQNGSAAPMARSEMTYDNALTTGNVTLQTSWDSTRAGYSNPLTSSNSISISNTYDSYGNVLTSTDARGIVTSYCYSTGDCAVSGQTASLYPTRIKAASNYTSLTRTTNRLYDDGTGLVTSVTDADNNVTTSTTYDVFGRPTLVKAADGKTEETRTATEYSDSDRRVIVRSDLNSVGDAKLVSIQHYDQLGRVRLTRQLEDAANQSATDETIGIKVQTRYAFTTSNSYALTSNPYRATYSGNAGSEVTMGWTRSKSDNAGRVVEIQTFGGITLPAPWSSSTTTTGTVTTSYDEEFTTVTDQAGKIRRSVTDGLGRLARVDEPDGNGNLGTTSSPNQATSYGYDALGNLLNVYQGSQTRTFVYSSLARLTSAQNPESGTITYAYDNDGNLSTKTDPRSITTTYAYDALNRVTSRSYSDSTPTVSYVYDTATNGKGRLTSVSSSVSSYSYGSYDALGRVLTGTQTIGSSYAYSTSYAYNRAGHVASIAYPSGHTVTNTFDGGGRLSSLAGTLGDNTSRTYSTGIVYDAGGRMTQEQFGTATAIYNKLFYNSRGQLAEIREGVTPNNTNWERGAIINHYSDSCWGMCSGSSMADNNGNLKKQDAYIPGGALFSQFYSYDSLNRLQSVLEDNPNGSANWKQSYVYDRYGNRTVDQNSANTYGNGIPKPNFGLSQSTNQLTAPAGATMHYDAAGNLDADTYSAAAVSRLYDAENRMTKETQASSYVAGEYSYDGDGRRVKRKVASVETWQVYGLGGELVAEYAANTSYTTPQKEYGYRNGQLLVTLTSPLTGGSPSFSDNPIQVGVTTVRAAHITELRTAINNLRSHLGISTYSWTTSATTNDYISANPILEMRTALDQALGAPSVGYASGLASGQPVKAIHIQELRDRLTAASGSDVRWMVTDQLGTPRMIFEASGSLATTSRHDYLPFGEELGAEVGGRTPQQGYSASDGVRQHFTGYEEDLETGLNFAQARYQSPMQGRFTSVDPYNAILEKQGDENSSKAAREFLSFLARPQNWNRYSYAANNPLKFIDPDGEEIRFSNADPAKQLTADEEAALRAAVATLRQQSAVADAFFSTYDKPSGKGPDLDVQVFADKDFDQLPEVSGDKNTLASTQPGTSEPNADGKTETTSAIMIIRQSEVNPASESSDRGPRHETKLEGIMSHEIVHGNQITKDLKAFLKASGEEKKNNIPYRQRPLEKEANLGSSVIIFERRLRGGVSAEQPRVRWPLHN